MFLKIKNILSLLLSNSVIFFIIPYKKKCYVTCAGKTDGLGAQVQAIYSALLYSFVNNIPYCHTPLNDVAHNYDNNASFNENIEHFFSFSKEEKLTSELKDYKIINLDVISFKSVLQILQYFFSSNNKIIFQKSHYHNYTNKISPKYILIKKRLQEKFYTNPKADINADTKYFQIAFHIRRGDVDKADITRYTTNEQIFNKLNELTQLLNSLNIPSKITIYSQGSLEDFGNLSQIASLHLNEDVFDDFYSLVKADILFMAKSSFSYSAALLSNGIIVYEPFWHPPLEEWFVFKNGEKYSVKFQDAVKLAYSKRTSI